jgi:hypothetical protein
VIAKIDAAMAAETPAGSIASLSMPGHSGGVTSRERRPSGLFVPLIRCAETCV